MILSILSAKQKRVQEWREFLLMDNIPERLKQEIAANLEVYGRIIKECADSGSISSDAEVRLGILNAS